MPDIFLKISRLANSTMKEFSMLNDGDRVLIGLSGGKDSLALVEVLAARQKIYKPKIAVRAVHVAVENVGYKADRTYLEQFCQSRGVEFETITTHFEKDKKENRTHCFLCAWSRRKALFNYAKEHNFNILALGHHQDDIIQTLLMNEIFTGSFSTMPPKLQMEKFDLTIIRPLCQIREAQIVELAKEHNYLKQTKNCPYEQESNRDKIKELLHSIEELNPQAVSSLWNAMSNVRNEYLPKKE